MLISRSKEPFPIGYTAVTEVDGEHSDMLMDFGILKLRQGDSFSDSDQGKERAYLLMTGSIRFEWGDSGDTHEVARRDLLDEEPTVLHVPAGIAVTITNLGDEAELAVQKRPNPKQFPSQLWKPGEYRSDRFGEGTLQDTSTRTVRTVFDAATAPDSEMVLGEVINHPGKWSSYPPHDHAQPEVYHFRHFPEQGFGFSMQGDTVYKVENYDTVTIPPHVVHPQTAAPGYAMYYLWMIPHLPTDRFGPNSRVFRKEHAWVQEPSAPIWPDEPISTVIEYQDHIE